MPTLTSTGKVNGSFLLTESEKASGVNGVRITGTIKGLTPNSKYNFYVHRDGVEDPSKACTNTGGIFDPLSVGTTPKKSCESPRQYGVIKEFTAGNSSDPTDTSLTVQAAYDYKDSQASLWGSNDIIGRSLVIYKDGNTTDILACCNIVLSTETLGITQPATGFSTCSIYD